MPLVPFHRLFWVWFDCGRGHRGPMIPYCPGAPMSCQSAPGRDFSAHGVILDDHISSILHFSLLVVGAP
ncbi:unnamed protein product [Staurois parvus]|uniref:Uncharacterized protein n=1 Tax=Staurois parvus TaxID=386267 RepID=A0ABN9DB01_9NEOB|nr:unnamed protein product [Staurois parvus]